MTDDRIASRLANQLLTRAGCATAADVVAWFGAMQAQEYAAARWAIALRLRDRTVDAAVEQAFDDGRILRTHVMTPFDTIGVVSSGEVSATVKSQRGASCPTFDAEISVSAV